MIIEYVLKKKDEHLIVSHYLSLNTFKVYHKEVKKISLYIFLD